MQSISVSSDAVDIADCRMRRRTNGPYLALCTYEILPTLFSIFERRVFPARRAGSCPAFDIFSSLDKSGLCFGRSQHETQQCFTGFTFKEDNCSLLFQRNVDIMITRHGTFHKKIPAQSA